MHSTNRRESLQKKIGCGTWYGTRISPWIPTCYPKVNSKPITTFDFIRKISIEIIYLIKYSLFFIQCYQTHRNDVYVKNVQGTMVVWLQNNIGFARWGPTETRVEALLEAFRPMREKDSTRSHLDVVSIMHHPTDTNPGKASPTNSSHISDNAKLPGSQTPSVANSTHT